MSWNYVDLHKNILDGGKTDQITVPVLHDNILPYSNEGLSVVQLLSISHTFSPKLTHIAPPFQLLQRLHWCEVYVLRTSYVENFRSDYWFVTWVENPSSASCGIVVPIVVSHVHQKRNHMWLMHTEFNFVYIKPLRFRLWWTCDTTIGTTGSHK